MSPIQMEEVKRPSVENSHTDKRQKPQKKYKKKYKAKDVDPTSPMGVLQFEVKEILGEIGLTEEYITNDLKEILNDKSVEEIYHREVKDVEILRLSSNGDGLAVIDHPVRNDGKQIVMVPFGLPGDIVNIRVFKSHPLYVESDLLSIVKPGDKRDDSLINCKYFGKCSGCQYQNVDYSEQLEFKRNTIANAYRFFAPVLSKDAKLPAISATQSSPIQYNYRTKLTPHFNVPNKKPENYYRPNMGFGAKGRPEWRETAGGEGSILDIEECSIGTPIVLKGMANERLRFEKDYEKYKRGATVLLRENTIMPNSEGQIEVDQGSKDTNDEISTVEVEDNNTKLVKTCVTESRAIVREYVNGFVFEFSAGEFFQNNNSILPLVTKYVEDNLQIPNSKPGEPNYLVDAYCGSGLFSITCSGGVSRVIGVEVSADSVKFARRNAENNKVENADFIVGKAEQIFANIDTPAERTSVILDPPRKGCDDVFLNQLSTYHPAKIVYISCNVHSQARDVEWFINNTEHGKDYHVESIKGFDFFPQTHHVESVAVLALN
ncbi:hypothetical protein FT663_04062 [Candidozyma haemuli var. vulneris]|nr:hypothetical protein FT662_03496 [[Candida] haemuloni var. vulneris]KAF3988379.1 hypothetical protein FT663_04062 [[Candida] haemuloni var. vulneris]